MYNFITWLSPAEIRSHSESRSPPQYSGRSAQFVLHNFNASTAYWPHFHFLHRPKLQNKRVSMTTFCWIKSHVCTEQRPQVKVSERIRNDKAKVIVSSNDRFQQKTKNKQHNSFRPDCFFISNNGNIRWDKILFKIYLFIFSHLGTPLLLAEEVAAGASETSGADRFGRWSTATWVLFDFGTPPG